MRFCTALGRSELAHPRLSMLILRQTREAGKQSLHAGMHCSASTSTRTPFELQMEPKTKLEGLGLPYSHDLQLTLTLLHVTSARTSHADSADDVTHNPKKCSNTSKTHGVMLLGLPQHEAVVAPVTPCRVHRTPVAATSELEKCRSRTTKIQASSSHRHEYKALIYHKHIDMKDDCSQDNQNASSWHQRQGSGCPCTGAVSADNGHDLPQHLEHEWKQYDHVCQQGLEGSLLRYVMVLTASQSCEQ